MTSDQTKYITMISDNDITVSENNAFYLHEESVLMNSVVS